MTIVEAALARLNMNVDSLLAERRELIATLADASEVLDNYADVRDCADGQPQANQAMSMKQDIDALLERLK